MKTFKEKELVIHFILENKNTSFFMKWGLKRKRLFGEKQHSNFHLRVMTVPRDPSTMPFIPILLKNIDGSLK